MREVELSRQLTVLAKGAEHPALDIQLQNAVVVTIRQKDLLLGRNVKAPG